METPCRKCQKRQQGCHSFCEEYKAFRQQLVPIRKKQRHEADVTDAIFAVKARRKKR